MDVFAHMGADLLQRWRRTSFDASAFPALAAEALQRTEPWRGFDRTALVSELIQAARPLPPQVNLDSGFGEPPLCVYWSAGFFIELLFWIGPRTNIHQHGFAGAFAVLEGRSLQARYSFTPEGTGSTHYAWGALRLEDAAELGVGHVEPIPCGDGLIHSVRHLAHPTVSLVVRTHGGEEGGLQYDYFPPGLALDTFRADPDHKRRMQLLALLFQVDRAAALDSLGALARQCSELERLELIKELQRELRADDARQALLASCPTGARARDLGFLDALHRSREINARAGVVTDPDHQLLLGLIEVLGDRARIDVWLARHRPDRSPAAWLETWLTEMHAQGTLGLALDAAAIASLPMLLDTATPSGVTPSAGAGAAPASLRERIAAQVAQARRTLQATPVWGPLFG